MHWCSLEFSIVLYLLWPSWEKSSGRLSSSEWPGQLFTGTSCGLTETLMAAVAKLSWCGAFWAMEGLLGVGRMPCGVGSWAEEATSGPGILEEHGEGGDEPKWRDGFYKRLALNSGTLQLVHVVPMVPNRAFQLGLLLTLLSVPFTITRLSMWTCVWNISPTKSFYLNQMGVRWNSNQLFTEEWGII